MSTSKRVRAPNFRVVWLRRALPTSRGSSRGRREARRRCETGHLCRSLRAGRAGEGARHRRRRVGARRLLRRGAAAAATTRAMGAARPRRQRPAAPPTRSRGGGDDARGGSGGWGERAAVASGGGARRGLVPDAGLRVGGRRSLSYSSGRLLGLAWLVLRPRPGPRPHRRWSAWTIGGAAGARRRGACGRGRGPRRRGGRPR